MWGLAPARADVYAGRSSWACPGPAALFPITSVAGRLLGPWQGTEGWHRPPKHAGQGNQDQRISLLLIPLPGSIQEVHSGPSAVAHDQAVSNLPSPKPGSDTASHGESGLPGSGLASRGLAGPTPVLAATQRALGTVPSRSDAAPCSSSSTRNVSKEADKKAVGTERKGRRPLYGPQRTKWGPQGLGAAHHPSLTQHRPCQLAFHKTSPKQARRDGRSTTTIQQPANEDINTINTVFSFFPLPEAL